MYALLLLVLCAVTQSTPIIHDVFHDPSSLPQIHQTELLNLKSATKRSFDGGDFFLLSGVLHKNTEHDFIVKAVHHAHEDAETFVDGVKVENDEVLAPIYIGYHKDDIYSSIVINFNLDKEHIGVVRWSSGEGHYVFNVEERGMVTDHENDFNANAQPINCGATEEHHSHHDHDHEIEESMRRSIQDSGVPSNTVMKNIEMLWITDNTILAKVGNTDAKVRSYIAGIVAQMNVAYERDVRTSITSKFFDIRRGSYATYSNRWFQDAGVPSGFDGMDIAIYLSTKFSGGVAWVGTVCRGDYSSGQSEVYNSDEITAEIVAHEIGHVVGGIHTHEHNPRIDNCGGGGPTPSGGGSIMSYCHDTRMSLGAVGKFGLNSERVPIEIRRTLDGGSCITALTGNPPPTNPPPNPPSNPPPNPPSNPPPNPPSNPPPGTGKCADDRGRGGYDGQCRFPFTYKGRTFSDCTSFEDIAPWCFKTDGDWGYCGACGNKPTTCADDRGRGAKTGTCQFPFGYKGKVYRECTSVEDVAPWCFKTDGDWGYCGACANANAEDNAGVEEGETFQISDDSGQLNEVKLDDEAEEASSGVAGWQIGLIVLGCISTLLVVVIVALLATKKSSEAEHF